TRLSTTRAQELGIVGVQRFRPTFYFDLSGEDSIEHSEPGVLPRDCTVLVVNDGRYRHWVDEEFT
ncbi:MAG: hypothetical protein ACRDFA_09190, partial [bacterium]